MNSPASAILWQIWRAHRWGLIVGWLYLLIAAIVVRLAPAFLAGASHATALPELGRHLAMPSVILLLHLMLAFSMSSLDQKETCYASFMFVLPVSTRLLVGLPVWIGSLAVAGAWVAIAGLVLRPATIAAPYWWPAAALALTLMLLQAISWTPVSPSWLRIAIALPILSLPAVAATLVLRWGVSEAIATAMFLAMLPFAYFLCYRGIAMTRRGDAYDLQWRRVMDRRSRWSTPSDRAFSSLSSAQFWFEFRCFGWGLPLFVLLTLVMVVGIGVLGDRTNPTLTWKLLAMMVFLPALLGGILSSQFGAVDFPFAAIRPISTAQLVRSKIRMALASSGLSVAAALLTAALFAALPGFRQSLSESLSQAIGEWGWFKSALALLAVLVFPWLLTAKGMIENFWIGLAGRPWLTNLFGVGLAIVFGIGTLIGVWISLRPDLQALLWRLAPTMIGLLVLVKLTLAAIVLWLAVHQEIYAPWKAMVGATVWCLIVAALVTAIYFAVPRGSVKLGMLFAIVSLVIPITRLAAAPVMLDWNRHR